MKISKFDALVAAFNSLPSIGKKSAIKLAYYCAFKDPKLGARLAHCLDEGLQFLRPCSLCGNIAQDELCELCEDEQRDTSLLCLVGDARDILSLEQAASFNGLYFVYDGSKDAIFRLINMIEQMGTKEIIFGFNQGINEESLIYFIEDKLKDYDLVFTQLARGIPSGVALENIDMMSLLKALAHRTKI